MLQARRTVGAVVALSLLALSTAAFANAGNEKRPLSLDDLRHSLNPEVLAANIPLAAEQVHAKAQSAFTRTSTAQRSVASAGKKTAATARSAFARAKDAPFAKSQALHSMQRRSVTAGAEKHLTTLKRSVDKLFKVDNKLVTAGKLASRHVEPAPGFAGAANQRRDDHTCDLDLSDPPKNMELMELCDDDNVCCQYKPILADYLDLHRLDVDALVCAMYNNTHFCASMVPDFAEDMPAEQEMDAVCMSPCKDAWIGFEILDELMTEFEEAVEAPMRRNDMPEAQDWTGIADWLCSKESPEGAYCALVNSTKLDFDPITSDGLDLLCGGCQSFYFELLDVVSATGEAGLVDTLMCSTDSDNDDAYCILNPPAPFADPEAPTQAEVAEICKSDCKLAWITAMFLDEVDLPGSDTARRHGMGPEAEMAALADFLCTQDTDEITYCAASGLDFDSIPDAGPTPGNLTAICDSGCKDYYLTLIADDAGFDVAVADAAFCSMDSNETFCFSTLPAWAEGSEAQTMGTICDSADCKAAWVSTLFLFGDDDDDEDGDMGGDTRRKGHMMPTPAEAADAMCTMDGEKLCVVKMMESSQNENQDEGSGYSREMLDQTCGVGPCGQVLPTIMRLLADQQEDGVDGPSVEETLAYLCARNGDGQYCLLAAMQALGPPGDSRRGNHEGMPIPGPIIDLMCGECLSKMGPENAVGLLFLVLFSAAGADRRNQDNGLSALLNFMCLKGPQGYCIGDPEVAVILDDEKPDDDTLSPADQFFQNLIPNPLLPWSPARAEVATTFCENTCVNAAAQIGLVMAFPSDLLECLDGGTAFAYQSLVNGCLQQNDKYCLEVVGSKSALTLPLSLQCGIQDDFSWDPPACSDDCKTAAMALIDESDGWGCCAGALDFPLIPLVESTCQITAPAACEAVGTLELSLIVPNLKSDWLTGKLTNKRIYNALAKDIGDGGGFGKGLVKRIESSARNGGGSTISCDVEMPSKELSKNVLRKLKGVGSGGGMGMGGGGGMGNGGGMGGGRRSDVSLGLTALAAEIPEEELAAALEDPEVGLAATVDSNAIGTTGAVLGELQNEVEREISGGDDATTPPPMGDTTPAPDGGSGAASLAAAAWVTALALAASVAAAS